MNIRIKNQLEKVGKEGRNMILTGTILASIIYLLFKTGNNIVAWIVIGIFGVVLFWEAMIEYNQK